MVKGEYQMADNNSTDEKVIKIIAEYFKKEVEDISLDTNLINDLGADSLDVVEICMNFEEYFGIKIPDEDAEKIDTIQAIIEYIIDKTNKTN